MDITPALRKKDARIWWLIGFRDETWKPLSILGIQLAASSVLGVLLHCQAPGRWWLFDVLLSYFYVWEKQHSNYQRSD